MSAVGEGGEEPSDGFLYSFNHLFASVNLEIVVIQALSHVQLFATPWTIARQIPPSKGFPRQEYWSGLPFPSPGDLPDPGIEPRSPVLAGGSFITEPLGKPLNLD